MLYQMMTMCRSFWFCAMCLCIVIHQACIGLSVYISVKLSSAVIEYGLTSPEVHRDVLIYIVLMIFPYLPGYLADHCKVRWESTVLAAFWAHKAVVYHQAPSVNKLGFYTAQVRDVYGRFTQFAHYGLGSLLNFSFSLTMIGVFIDERFLLAIIVTLILVFIVSRLTHFKMQLLAENESEASSLLIHCLKDIHLNALSGNHLNRSCWQRRAMAQVTSFAQVRNTHSAYQSSVFLLSALFSLLPASGLIMYLMISAEISQTALLALIMNLTRIYHLIGSINDVIEIFLSIPSIQGLINTLIAFDQTEMVDSRMDPALICVDGKPSAQFDLTTATPGRFRVSGKNGSGKTTFLRRLESAHQILYFNPARRVDWPWPVHKNWSDGEYSRHCLEWLLTKTEGPLALDEWDAFLDMDNRNALEQLIEAQSRYRIILEVRQSGALN